MRCISRIPPGDGTIGCASGPGISAPVFMPDPGIDRQKVVAPENTKESFGGVGTESVLGENRRADFLRRDLGALPERKIELAARDAAGEKGQAFRAITAADPCPQSRKGKRDDSLGSRQRAALGADLRDRAHDDSLRSR